MKPPKASGFSAGRIASRVAALGKEITRTYKGRRLDVVVTLDRAFVFAADLIRHIDVRMVCHFVREKYVIRITVGRPGEKSYSEVTRT